MSTIRDLEHNVSELTLTGMPSTTVAKHAALQIMDNHTLAVVPFAERYRELIEETLNNQDLGAKEITITRGVITIQI